MYEIVSSSEGSQSSGITVQALFEATGLPRRKVQVILSQLESAGILERRAGKIKCIRTFATPEEMTGFLGAYEQRHMDDRQRIETMMRYAETTFCRVRFLREYFGAIPGRI